jgi:hypothetical protein
MTFDFDEAAARVVADPLERTLFDRLGRERVHPITVSASTGWRCSPRPASRSPSGNATTISTFQA